MEEATSSGFRSVLLTIAVVSLVANVHAEAAGDRQVGVTLTGGQIDSSTVKVGAFAVVIHGLGERHPVSGEWEQLKTARGYIVAIDVETLVLGLDQDEWPEVIALERIQTLVLVGGPGLKEVEQAGRRTRGELTSKARSFSPRAPDIDSTEVDSSRVVSRLGETPDGLSGKPKRGRLKTTDDRGTGRMILKLGAGFWVGIFSAYTLGEILVSQQGSDYFAQSLAAGYGVVFGYVIGTATGATLVDSHDRFIMALSGSSVGMGLGIMAAELSGGWSLVLCPVVGATIASELSRDAPEDSRFSIGLVPGPKGHLSAVATLRF